LLGSAQKNPAPVSAGGDKLADDAVMTAIAARDSSAFADVVAASGERLRRIAYRMLGDAAEAEDVAQESLLRLWNQAPRWRFDGPGSGAWLHRVAVNLCFDRLRKKRFCGEDDMPERADDTPGADEQMDENKMRHATKMAISALPERHRAAIILTYYEEVSNQSAADVLDMNVKAFESLLLRAKQSLRRTLESDGMRPRFSQGNAS
jgi:RNA polymerase sigma factor (sigma-70 family)